MPGRSRLPMFAVAAALLGLVALLATLQYKWLGQISDAERERMTATLNSRASGFARDFDAELTRAFLQFQLEPSPDGNTAAGVAARYDRWQATARYPRLVKDVYVASDVGDTSIRLHRFDPVTRLLEPADWPSSMLPLRAQLAAGRGAPPAGGLVLRTMVTPVWDNIPALVIPMPVLFLNRHQGTTDVRLSPPMSYTVLLLDREYVAAELLPALAQQHFRQTGDGFDYEVAVVSTEGRGLIYHSVAGFSPRPDAKVDATVDLFQVRLQDFGAIAAEVRRFAALFTTAVPAPGPAGHGKPRVVVRDQFFTQALPGGAGLVDDGTPARRFEIRGSTGVSVVVRQDGRLNGGADGPAPVAAGAVATIAPRWRLLVKHPWGSLEAAVNSARRRNLMISSSILAVLGASVGLLVLSTRRAHELARQQMEFVAAVSHELRTPLAVIRSAGDNLADGVIHDEELIRKYGELVRNEGRRLTEMVEQILELAGMQSGQRGFALRPVAIAPMLRDIVESSRALVDAAGMQVEYDFADGLPPVLGEEAALRRVFQNLVANAIKYGTSGGWIGLGARQVGNDIHVTVADRGIGIAASEQPRIFEPFYRTPEVIAARIQGAGLGLSLVKRMVEAHGGRVAVHSSPGAGSTFTVILPAGSEESAAPAGHAVLSEPPRHESRA